jgi:hypothetical protein
VAVAKAPVAVAATRVGLAAGPVATASVAAGPVAMAAAGEFSIVSRVAEAVVLPAIGAALGVTLAAVGSVTPFGTRVAALPVAVNVAIDAMVAVGDAETPDAPGVIIAAFAPRTVGVMTPSAAAAAIAESVGCTPRSDSPCRVERGFVDPVELGPGLAALVDAAGCVALSSMAWKSAARPPESSLPPDASAVAPAPADTGIVGSIATDAVIRRPPSWR